MRRQPLKVEAPELRLDPERVTEPFAWNQLFPVEQPVEVEIGIGKGRFLLEAAERRPQINHLGVEWANKYLRFAESRAQRRELENIRFVRIDAREMMASIPARSVQAFYVFYPDPWPKKRHHKRRIVQASFLALCADRLIAGGSLHVATDWANYAEHIDTLVKGLKQFVVGERREHDGDQPLDRPRTKFEQRGLQMGHRIWDWRFDRLN